MADPREYGAIVIGAGQAGGPLASAFARAGRKTALIEREHVGGTCINEGCTPTKTMVASARVAYLARRAADYGVQTGPVVVDLAKVRERKRDIVEDFRSGSERRIVETEGLDLYFGEASFTGPKSLAVRPNDRGPAFTLHGETIVINTGARPSMPDVPGLHFVPTLNSTTIMELDHVPQHLLVLGGSYVGLEFAQMFRRFGSRVTVVQRSEHLLSREDSDVAAAVAEILREDGIELLLQTNLVRADEAANGGVAITVETQQGERTLDPGQVLVAMGRTPNTEHLNLDAAGVALDDKGFITVNDRLQTNVPGIYAVGDVHGGPAFTHISYDDYRILKANLLGGGPKSTTGRLVPYTVFIDPQLGRVGLTEAEARSRGLDYRVAKLPMSDVARALEVDESRGFMKAVVDAQTKQILGVAVLGIEGGELMSMLEIAIMGKLPYTDLRDAIFAHPTLAESLNNLFATLDEN